MIPPEATAGFAALPVDAVIPPEFEIAHRTFTNPQTQAEVSFTIPWRRAELPAVGGHGNARSVAVAQHAVSHGGLAFGRRILSPNATDVIFREQYDGLDRVLFSRLQHGIGYALSGELQPLPSARMSAVSSASGKSPAMASSTSRGVTRPTMYCPSSTTNTSRPPDARKACST